MNLDQYLGVFIDESRENLQALNEYLLQLESNLSDISLLHEIFRVIHTLKGMSASMGFENIAELTHDMENVLDLLRNEKLTADSDILDVLFSCLDRLEGFLEKVIENNNDEGEIKDLVKDLERVVSGDSTPDLEKTNENGIASFSFNEFEIAVLSEAKSQGNEVMEVNVFLEETCILPAARAYMVEKVVEPFGEIIKSIPDTEKLEEGEFEGSFKLFIVTQADSDYVKSSILDVSEIDKVEVSPITDFRAASIGEEVDNTAPEPEQEKAVEPPEVKKPAGQSAKPEVKEPPKKADKPQKADKAKKNGSKIPQTIRVSAERLDLLMNLVGELVINRTRVEQISQDNQYNSLNGALNLMGSVTNDIQEIVMKLRMVPIENVFNRFPRLVRDISKELGKKVELVINGQDTEMDRAVIEDLGDPLVHLVRNSLDHGLETTEERAEKGKPEKGTIELAAYNEGDHIIVKVSDDGKGLNVEKIVQKVVAKGLVTQEAVNNMSEKEKNELIFLPGFSTHDVATDLSGRGVGMDVVKTKISNIGGTVHLETEKDKGTSVIIRLPSTIVILQALLVNVGDEVYAVPLNNINEVIDIEVGQITTVQKQEVILLRGKTLPLKRMNRILDIDEGSDSEENLTVVIVQSSGKQVGIVVSDLIGQKEVVIKPINKKYCDSNYFSGATTLGNGNVALIINVNGII